ncbi:MAG: phage tail tape measure protein [Quinella sp. 1Q5]|nr:phage tail tape measure protein [Quinella sp. 1Q5]
MSKTRTISFVIDGKDNLSGVLARAVGNVKKLSDINKSLNAKALAQATRLASAQAALQNLHSYRKLQQAHLQAQKSYLTLGQNMGKLFAQRKAEQSQLDDMQKAYAKLKDAYKANWRNMGTQAAQTMKEQIRNANQELKAQAKVIANLDRAYDSSSASITKLKARLATQQSQLTQARQGLPAGVLAAHEMQLRAQINQTTAALNREIAALERRNQVFGNFSQRQQDLSNAYSNMQGALDTAQTLMNPFKDAADNAMTFEKAMSRVKSLTQMRNIRSGNFAQVAADMKELTAQAEALGMTTEFTATEVAQAQGYFGMAGWDKQKILSVMPTALDLASISGDHNLARTADVLSDMMTAFGVKAGEGYKLAGGKVVDGAKYFGDAFAYAVTQSNMDRETLFEAWKYNAPVARAMGLSLGETVAQNMILAGAGIKGSMSGTSLRQFWVRMSAPPKAAAKSLEELGFAANDAAAQVAETQLAMQEAGVSMDSDWFTKFEAIGKFYQEQKAAGRDMTGWLKGLTGQTALSGVMSLFEPGKLEEIKRYKEEIDSGFAGGWAADTAKIMRDNTQTTIDYMTSALDALQKAGGDALLPSIRGIAESITPLISSMAQWTKQNPAVVQGLAAVASVASTAIVSIAGFSLAMAGLRFAQAGLQTAGELFTYLGTKATAARGAIVRFAATVGTALSGLTLSGAVAGMKAFGAATLAAARAGLAFMFTPIGAALTAIAAAAYFAYQNWDRVSAAFSTLGSALSSSLGPAFSNLGTSVGNLMTALSPLAGVFETLGGVIVSVFVGALGTVGSLLSGLAVLLTGLFTSVIEFGTGVVDAFGKIKDGDLSGALDSLKEHAASSADSFKNAWLDAAAAVKSGLQGTDAAVQALWTQPALDVSSRVAMGASALPTSWGQVDASTIVQPIADASSQAADSLNQVQMPAAATGQSLLPLPPAIDGATNSSTQLATALPAPIDGLSALGPAASSAAGALEAAAARINSIQISVPQVNYIPMNIPVAPAGKGFAKGGFVSSTTNFFAGEHGAESIIPLNRSQRSFDLWQETGDLLGFNQGSSPINISLTFHIQGNADVPTFKNEVVPLIQKTFAEQLADFNQERRRRSFV